MIKIYNFFISNLFILVFILKNIFYKKNNYKFKAIIFSYNRPLQLQALIKSLINLFDKKINIIVLFKCDTFHEKSYYKLIKKFKSQTQFDFIEQNISFKNSIIEIIKKIKINDKGNTNLIFFVDDQILFRNIYEKELNKLSKLSPISTLRIGLNTKWSYNLNKKQSLDSYIFEVKENCIVWSPKFINDEISYIFSFDGSTIPLSLFESLSKYLIYKGPNSLETSMNYGDIFYKLFKLKVSSNINQSIVNIVISQVQSETQNRGLFVDIKKLERFYRDNWELKLDSKILKKFNSPHSDKGAFLFNKKKIIKLN